MPEQTMSEEEDVLSSLAPLAKAGTRAIVVIGKVKELKPRPANENRVAHTAATVIVGEGETMILKIPQGASIPGVGYQGAFLIGKPSEYMNVASAPCLGFA